MPGLSTCWQLGFEVLRGSPGGELRGWRVVLGLPGTRAELRLALKARGSKPDGGWGRGQEPPWLGSPGRCGNLLCGRQSPPGLVVNLAASFVVASCRKAPAAKPARRSEERFGHPAFARPDRRCSTYSASSVNISVWFLFSPPLGLSAETADFGNGHRNLPPAAVCCHPDRASASGALHQPPQRHHLPRRVRG